MLSRNRPVLLPRPRVLDLHLVGAVCREQRQDGLHVREGSRQEGVLRGPVHCQQSLTQLQEVGAPRAVNHGMSLIEEKGSIFPLVNSDLLLPVEDNRHHSLLQLHLAAIRLRERGLDVRLVESLHLKYSANGPSRALRLVDDGMVGGAKQYKVFVLIQLVPRIRYIVTRSFDSPGTDVRFLSQNGA